MGKVSGVKVYLSGRKLVAVDAAILEETIRR